jgi:hypothetical protein
MLKDLWKLCWHGQKTILSVISIRLPCWLTHGAACVSLYSTAIKQQKNRLKYICTLLFQSC